MGEGAVASPVGHMSEGGPGGFWGNSGMVSASRACDAESCCSSEYINEGVSVVCKYTPMELFAGFGQECRVVEHMARDFDLSHTVAHVNL
ncbi:MAG: hypothetical protein J5804_06105, partial [Eggerthellaceae bacterium]|nr:hypothetical protein [Eggerthellaceae bacterium]